MHHCTLVAGPGVYLGNTFGQAISTPWAVNWPPIQSVGSVRTTLRLFSSAEIAAAQPPSPPPPITRSAATSKGRTEEPGPRSVSSRRGPEESREPESRSFKKPSAIYGAIEPLGKIGVSVTMKTRSGCSTAPA